MKNLMLAVATCVLSAAVYAQPPGPENMEEMKTAMEACANELGITLPERGSRERPDRDVMQSLDSCMSDKGFERPKGPPRGDHDGHGPQEFDGEDN